MNPSYLSLRTFRSINESLKRRFNDAQAELQNRLHNLSKHRAELESSEEQQLEQLQRECDSQDAKAITEWDDELERYAEAADRKVWQSIEQQKSKLNKLEQERKSRLQFFQQQYTQALHEADIEYKKHKDDPRHEYEQIMQQLQATAKPSAQAVVEARELAQYRGIRIHHEKPNEKFDRISSLLEATEHLGELHSKLHHEVDLLRFHPLAKITETFWFWVLSIGLALASGGLAYGLAKDWVIAGIGVVSVWVISAIAIRYGLRVPLKNYSSKHYPTIEILWADCQQALQTAEQFARQQAENKLNALQEKHEKSRADAEKHWKANAASLEERVEADKKELKRTMSEFRDKVEKEFVSRVQQANEAGQALQVQRSRESHGQLVTRRELKLQRLSDVDKTAEQWKERTGFRVAKGLKSAQKVSARLKKSLEQHYHPWNHECWSQGLPAPVADEPAMVLGSLKLITPALQVSAYNSNQKSAVAADQAIKASGEEVVELPVAFLPLSHSGLLVRSDLRQGEKAKKILTQVVMRALTSLPPGKVFLTVIDPRGLGRDFSWLMHLADFDPRLVQHRVWTEPVHIGHHLGELVRHSEQVIQQQLRDRYKNLHAYNQQAGSLAEPYHFVLWPDFPFGCDEASWKSIVSLLQAGPRCGVAICLQHDESIMWPNFMEKKAFDHIGLRLKVEDSGEVKVQEDGLQTLPFEMEQPPDDELKSRLIRACGIAALEAGKIELPLRQVLGDVDTRWQENAAKLLDVPLGQSGPGRTVSMRLGIGTNQHVLIAGKTGSGKSTLLHTLITSAAMRYSPEQLRLILLDFKKGVEFQIYAEGKLPHADIIGIESQREFGVSALEFLDQCLQQRGELFRDSGVQDLVGWTLKNPDKPMPRVLLVIDEFQELFIQDDKLAQQAALLLDRVVRQGRSFGVHAILASQTLAGAYSLPRTTLGQMGVRIALQCDEADAAVILSDDNLAASRLSYPGQAIYNNAGGRIEGNQPLQVAWVSAAEQKQWFTAMQDGPVNRDTTTNRLEKPIVFEGHKPSTWQQGDLDNALKSARQLLGQQSHPIVIGDAVAIRPAVCISRTSQPGRNMLMVGSDSRLASRVALLAIRSQARSAELLKEPMPRWKFLYGARPNDPGSDQFVEQLRTQEDAVAVVAPKDVESELKAIGDLIEQRQSHDHSQLEPIWLVVWQLDRFRNLKRGEEFSFGSDDEASLEKTFSRIVRDGPTVGVHTLIWADSFSTASRWLSRATLNDCEVRVLMQMSAADSNHLIDSNAAAQLGPQLVLVYDHSSGVIEKARPVVLVEAKQ